MISILLMFVSWLAFVTAIINLLLTSIRWATGRIHLSLVEAAMRVVYFAVLLTLWQCLQLINF